MNTEYNIFLLWSSARAKDKEVKKAIEQKFEIVNSYEIFWSPEWFTRNLSRFYGKKLPSARSKLKLCGKGSFLVHVVKDNQPEINDKGDNRNMLLMKRKLREILGGNYLHASDNQNEAEENLYFLLGKSLRRILADPKLKKPTIVKQDIIGTPTWLDEDRMRRALKRVPEAIMDRKNRVITCDNVMFACRILNARKIIWPWKKDKYKISIRGRDDIFTIKKN